MRLRPQCFIGVLSDLFHFIVAVSNSISPPIYERKYVNDQLVPVDSPDYPFKLNAAKSVKILGIKYRSMEETAKDILVDFKSRGW